MEHVFKLPALGWMCQCVVHTRAGQYTIYRIDARAGLGFYLTLYNGISMFGLLNVLCHSVLYNNVHFPLSFQTPSPAACHSRRAVYCATTRDGRESKTSHSLFFSGSMKVNEVSRPAVIALASMGDPPR